MTILRPIGFAIILTLTLAAQGVTEVIPQSGFSSNISADGSVVLFGVGTGSTVDVRVYETATGITTTPIVPAFGGSPFAPVDSWAPSGDGRFVVFKTSATNLGFPTGGAGQIWVVDRQTGQLEIVSKSSAGVIGNAGSQVPSISDDGRWVAFASYSSNLVAGDTNGTLDVFLHDRLTHVTTRVSVNGAYQSVSASSQPAISGDGNWVVFSTNDPLLASCARPLYHRTNGFITCPFLATPIGVISRDGNRITTGYSPTYVTDLSAGWTLAASVLPDGSPATGTAGILSPDGGFFYFRDYSGRHYLRDILAGVTHVVNVDSGGTIHDDACMYSPYPNWTCNGNAGGVADFGRHVSFSSKTSSLAPGGTANVYNVYLHHLTPHLGAPASVAQGSIAALQLSAVEHPGTSYVVALSTGYSPGVLVDWRWAPLVPDDLLAYSLTQGAAFLVGFQGALGASGNADTASIQIPVAAGLSGASFYAAFAVLDPTAASGIAAFSNAAPIVIQ